MLHTLSVSMKCLRAGDSPSICVKAIVLLLAIFNCTAEVGAQPVDSPQLQRKTLPSDPVGKLFNDGPRVVYIQESGADPIEKLFWDRELKQEALRKKIHDAESKPSEEKTDSLSPEPIKSDPISTDSSDSGVAEKADDASKKIVEGNPNNSQIEKTTLRQRPEPEQHAKTKQSATTGASDSVPQSTKRAADAGKVDGVRINGAQWPVGAKPKYTYGKPRADGRPWQGLVFDLPVGTHVKAIDAGRVMYANDFKNYGNLVIIDHGDRVASVYANNQRLLVKEGDLIGTGDLIALSGQSGSLDYPALYFEIRKEGKPVDPLQFLKRR